MTSAYIHIPFCEHICYYCDFNKVFLEGQPVDEYIEMLLKEIHLTKERDQLLRFAPETLYIGGGTPTALSAKQLERLLSGLQREMIISPGREFTVEANPGDLTYEKLQVLKNHGVNRLSMGVQSFDDILLKKIGRKHSVKDVHESINLMKKAGFDNISIDLIYALPNQTLENFADTLEQALAFDLPHYSLYSLILENKTMFYNWVRQGRMELVNEDLEGDMFDLAIQKMTEAGLKQYEISNFSKMGQESQHNLVYWNNEHYYGFGAGASGYIAAYRYRNHGPIQHYLQPLRAGKLPILETEVIDRKKQIEEELFLGLRKLAGISLSHFEEKFACSIEEIYGDVLPDLIARGLLKKEQDRLALTKQGMFLGNEVFEQFLLDE